jgi:hypothetical protein
MSKNLTISPDEIEYSTSVEGNLAIMREINKITFLERMKPLMTEVAKELVRAGVDFSKVKTDG